MSSSAAPDDKGDDPSNDEDDNHTPPPPLPVASSAVQRVPDTNNPNEVKWDQVKDGCTSGPELKDIQRFLSMLTRVELSEGPTRHTDSLVRSAPEVYERLVEQFVGACGYFDNPKFKQFFEDFLDHVVCSFTTRNFSPGALLCSTYITRSRPGFKKTGKNILDTGKDAIADITNVYLPAWRAQLKSDGTLHTGDTWESVLEKTKIHVFRSKKLYTRATTANPMDADDMEDPYGTAGALPSGWKHMIMRNWLSFVFCGPYGSLVYGFEPIPMLQLDAAEQDRLAKSRNSYLEKEKKKKLVKRTKQDTAIEDLEKLKLQEQVNHDLTLLHLKHVSNAERLRGLGIKLQSYSSIATAPHISPGRRGVFFNKIDEVEEETREVEQERADIEHEIRVLTQSNASRRESEATQHSSTLHSQSSATPCSQSSATPRSQSSATPRSQSSATPHSQPPTTPQPQFPSSSILRNHVSREDSVYSPTPASNIPSTVAQRVTTQGGQNPKPKRTRRSKKTMDELRANGFIPPKKAKTNS